MTKRLDAVVAGHLCLDVIPDLSAPAVCWRLAPPLSAPVVLSRTRDWRWPNWALKRV